jgi:molybdopterin-guanine dinucleotide biosynthesis protein A
MTAPRRIGAIVLAGGRSRRFGRDKLVEPVDGRPLLERAIAAVRSVAAAADVIVVTGRDATLPLDIGVRLAHDEVIDEGPLAGLVVGLAAIDPDVERVVVVGGDMPDLVPGVLIALAAALDGADAAILEVDDRVRALPMALRVGPAGRTASALFASGERRLRAVPLALGAAVVPAATWRAIDPSGATIHDIDTPADLGRS